jgi:hypothetical protein
MTQSSVLSKYFEDIEACGGTGTCVVTYLRAPTAGAKKEQVSRLRFQVEIMVPFTHTEQELLAMGTGIHEPQTSFLVNSLDDLEYPFQKGRMAAFKAAVADFAADVRLQMLQVRPTTSTRKQQRKIHSLLKKMGASGLPV